MEINATIIDQYIQGPTACITYLASSKNPEVVLISPVGERLSH